MHGFSSLLFGTSVSDQLIALADADEQERLKRFKDAWNAYVNGSDKPLKVETDQPDDNLIIPYEQVIVNKGKSYLFGDSVAFNVVPDADEQFEQEQRRIKKKESDRAKLEAVRPAPDTNDSESSEQTSGEPAPKQPTPEPPQDGQETAEDLTLPEREPPTKSELAQEYLDTVWRRNRMMTTLLKLGTNGGVYGHAFIKFVVKPGQELPRLVVLDPATVSVGWNPEDIDDEPFKYAITWNTITETLEGPKGIVRRQRIERPYDPLQGEFIPGGDDVQDSVQDDDPDAEARAAAKWLIIDEWADLSGGGTNIYGWTEISTKFWPFEWPPIIDCQNIPIPNEYWGRSDIEKVIQDLNYVINRLMSNINRIIRLHAHPQVYATGVSSEQLENLEWAPDSILPLPPGAEIGSLEMQSDLKSSIETYLKLKEVFHEVTRIPEVAAGKLEAVGNLSGTALDILYGPLKELTQEKRQTYGEMFTELNHRILEYGNADWTDLEVATNWPDVVPNDPVAESQAYIQDKQFGASNETLLEARGYDPEQERERREAEHAEAMQKQADLLSLQGPIPEAPGTQPGNDNGNEDK